MRGKTHMVGGLCTCDQLPHLKVVEHGCGLVLRRDIPCEDQERGGGGEQREQPQVVPRRELEDQLHAHVSHCLPARRDHVPGSVQTTGIRAAAAWAVPNLARDRGSRHGRLARRRRPSPAAIAAAGSAVAMIPPRLDWQTPRPMERVAHAPAKRMFA